MNKNIKRLFTTFLITFALMYACFVIVKQEMQFVEYKQEIETYARLIEEEELKNEQLNITKSSISSDKYIEEVAREKLGLVLPSEIIFVNANI
ncbi:MAG: septum formation initiator family protein [Clostridia bacterium]|nr:septum formation initiator family protein [Clostridia bacterium]